MLIYPSPHVSALFLNSDYRISMDNVHSGKHILNDRSIDRSKRQTEGNALQGQSHKALRKFSIFFSSRERQSQKRIYRENVTQRRAASICVIRKVSSSITQREKLDIARIAYQLRLATIPNVVDALLRVLQRGQLYMPSSELYPAKRSVAPQLCRLVRVLVSFVLLGLVSLVPEPFSQPKKTTRMVRMVVARWIKAAQEAMISRYSASQAFYQALEEI